MTFSNRCIYTILHPEKLRSDYVAFREGKRWVTAEKLWRGATAAGQNVPVLFADATNCSRLLRWGLLTNIKINENGTRCWVNQLCNVKGSHAPLGSYALSARAKKSHGTSSDPTLFAARRTS